MQIKLTGKTRYRTEVRFLSTPILVLQVEELVTGRERSSNDGGMIEFDSLPDITKWRDATIFDLQELNK